MRRRALAFATLAGLSCGGGGLSCSKAARERTLPPEGQLVIHVATDALLPPPPGVVVDADATPGLFDQLSIEIFLPGQNEPCAECARQFAVDAKMFDEGRASMGFVPKPGATGARARVRLFRTRGSEIVEPRPTSTLEAVVALPAVGAEGIVDVTVTLRTESLGAPLGSLEAPAAVQAGKPAPRFAGSWAPARQRDCAGSAEPGEVCVRGGAFWFGKPAIDFAAGDRKHGLERLVAVAPYYLDATEVTVATFRASRLATADDPVLPTSAAPHCTFTDDPGPTDQLPVTCISPELARRFCEAGGKRLPTEAEWELAATAIGHHDQYPWGNEPPQCTDAIFARDYDKSEFGQVCGAALGPAPPGSAPRDRVRLRGGEIVDLAGNVAEWVADVYNDEWESCWASPILLNPLCASQGARPRFTSRGAHYAATADGLDVTNRYVVGSKAPAKIQTKTTGFRCARPAP